MTPAIKAMSDACVRGGLRYRQSVHLFETWYLAQAVSACDGNLSKAAEIVGMDRTAINRRFSKRSEGKT